MIQNNTTLGYNLRAWRKDAGLTQEDLAAQVGVSFQAVSKWENDNSLPDVLMLQSLAGVFGTSMDELLSGGPKSSEFPDAAEENSEPAERQKAFWGNIYGDISKDIHGDVGKIMGNVRADIYGNVMGHIYGDVHNIYGNVEGNVFGRVNGTITGYIRKNLYGTVTGSVKLGVRGKVFGSVIGDGINVEPTK